MKVKKAWANPFLAKMTIEQTYGEIHSIFSDQVDWTLLEMSQISGIEKNEDEFYELVKGGYEYKKYIPDDYDQLARNKTWQQWWYLIQEGLELKKQGKLDDWSMNY